MVSLEYVENLQKQLDLLIESNDLQNKLLENLVLTNKFLLERIEDLEKSYGMLSALALLGAENG